MAEIAPFRPYRYAPSAGPLENLVTQPYDKISPEMQRRYLQLHPNNLVRIILGERFDGDTEVDNVYRRAAAYINEWIASGILVREVQPCLFSYSQEFTSPDSGDRLVRQGFIGLGAVEDYSQGVVHRHEQTLSGPKRDRTELLRHTRSHFGQIFMLYPDAEGTMEAMLADASAGVPDAVVTDEYHCIHRLWRIGDPARIEAIRDSMAPRKLMIADGHHRYETALAFRKDNPELEDARRVMMTFVSMHSPGLKILPTHRLVSGLSGLDPDAFLHRASAKFRVERLRSLDDLRTRWAEDHPRQVRIGAAFAGRTELFLLEAAREGALDVEVLHRTILAELLGIGEEAVRDEKHLRYVRGVDVALAQLTQGAAQSAFLLEPPSVHQVAAVAFGGGVMPQKSTDFYPKLLSGLTIYRLEK